MKQILLLVALVFSIVAGYAQKATKDSTGSTGKSIVTVVQLEDGTFAPESLFPIDQTFFIKIPSDTGKKYIVDKVTITKKTIAGNLKPFNRLEIKRIISTYHLNADNSETKFKDTYKKLQSNLAEIRGLKEKKRELHALCSAAAGIKPDWLADGTQVLSRKKQDDHLGTLFENNNSIRKLRWQNLRIRMYLHLGERLYSNINDTILPLYTDFLNANTRRVRKEAATIYNKEKSASLSKDTLVLALRGKAAYYASDKKGTQVKIFPLRFFSGMNYDISITTKINTELKNNILFSNEYLAGFSRARSINFNQPYYDAKALSGLTTEQKQNALSILDASDSTYSRGLKNKIDELNAQLAKLVKADTSKPRLKFKKMKMAKDETKLRLEIDDSVKAKTQYDREYRGIRDSVSNSTSSTSPFAGLITLFKNETDIANKVKGNDIDLSDLLSDFTKIIGQDTSKIMNATLDEFKAFLQNDVKANPDSINVYLKANDIFRVFAGLSLIDDKVANLFFNQFKLDVYIRAKDGYDIASVSGYIQKAQQCFYDNMETMKCNGCGKEGFDSSKLYASYFAHLIPIAPFFLRKLFRGDISLKLKNMDEIIPPDSTVSWDTKYQNLVQTENDLALFERVSQFDQACVKILKTFGTIILDNGRLAKQLSENEKILYKYLYEHYNYTYDFSSQGFTPELDGSVTYKSQGKFSIRPDFGLGYANNFRTQKINNFGAFLPFFGLRFNFYPLDPNVPVNKIKFQDWLLYRSSLNVSWSFIGISDGSTRANAFQNLNFVLGYGYRINNYLNVSAGALFFKEKDTEPFVSTMYLTAMPYLAFTFDFDMVQSFKDLINVFTPAK